MNESILIVGGGGLLGGALLACGRREGLAMEATTHNLPADPAALHRLDLREPLDNWHPPTGCRSAVLCSAITSLETCQRDPAGTRWINVTQTLRLAERLLAAKIFVVFISTNLVFDGTRPARRTDEPTSPLTEYGRQKAEVETALKTFGDSAAVVRLTKVLNPRWPLLCGWIELLRARQPVRAFTDMVCAPIPLDTVAHGLAAIASSRLPGRWQFSAAADVSYAGIAQHLASRLNVPAALVTGISCRENPSLEHSPQHTTLDTSRARRDLKLNFPAALAAVDETYFHE